MSIMIISSIPYVNASATNDRGNAMIYSLGMSTGLEKKSKYAVNTLEETHLGESREKNRR